MAKHDSSSGGSADPNKLPAHLRPMIGAKAGSSSSAGGEVPQVGVPAAGSTSGAGGSWKSFLRTWWFLLIGMPLLIHLRCNVWSPYKIPTGSMEPQLLGNDDNGDRVLVDLRAYRSSDPQRWDIAVFKSPELKKGAKSAQETKDIEYVKRCVGVAGDRIVVSGGDLYNVTRGTDGREIFSLLRKPAELQQTVWHTLYNFPHDFAWETPTELTRHGDWTIAPDGACTPAEDLQSFRLAVADGGTWRVTLHRTQDRMLLPKTEPAPVAGPVMGPVAGPVAGPIAGPVAGPQPEPTEPADTPAADNQTDRLSILSNRYLKTGDYWFRVPHTSLAPFRAHIRGSESVLVVPDDIHPENPDGSAAQAADVKRWKGRRLYPIPLTWYAGNAEIESHRPASERERNAELWRLTPEEKTQYLQLRPGESLPDALAAKAENFHGTSVRIGQSYGGVFGVNDIRLELKLQVHSWGRRFRAVFDQELSANGRQVLRRYGFTVENGQAMPWVEEWNPTTGQFQAVAPVKLENRPAPNENTLAVTAMADGEQRWVLEHYDGTIRLARLDTITAAQLEACGFAYSPAPRAMKQHSAGLYLEGEGSDLEFRRIQVDRDLYYLWDEFNILTENGVVGNLTYRTSNANFLQMPDQYLVHRTDGLTEFDLTVNADQPALGRYLMFGDNTVSSIDSRYFGPVERWRFIGQYWFTFWPPSRAEFVR